MYSLEIEPRNYRKYAIVSTCMVVGGLIFSLWLFPTIVVKTIKWQLQLKPGYLVRKLYTQVPFPLVFKVYLFDILNKDEVKIGGKPHFREVGPYIFHEYIYKYDLTDDKEADTLEFTLRKTYIFKPELSNGLTGDEIITTLHPVINGIALAVNVDRQPMLPLASTAIEEIFHPTDAFWTGRAMDLMFDGIPIDCSSTNFNAKAVCSVFETGESQAIQPVDDENFKFSLLGGYNHTSNGVFKVYRGKNVKDVGRILEVDGEAEMDFWDGDECNQYKGTDGLIFPPFSSPEDGVWAHEKAICRSMGVKFEKKSRYRGISTHFFTLDLGDIAADEKLHCFCREEDECPLKGTMDLFPCLGVPITATMPHFYEADPSLMEMIGSGLSPNITQHKMFVHMELFTGVPLSAAKRLQFNFELEPIEQVEVMKSLPKMVFPWFWVEEGVNLPSLYLNLLKFSLIWAQRINKLIKYISFIFGIPIAIFCVTVHVLVETNQISIKGGNIVKQFVSSAVVSDKSRNIDIDGEKTTKADNGPYIPKV